MNDAKSNIISQLEQPRSLLNEAAIQIANTIIFATEGEAGIAFGQEEETLQDQALRDEYADALKEAKLALMRSKLVVREVLNGREKLIKYIQDVEDYPNVERSEMQFKEVGKIRDLSEGNASGLLIDSYSRDWAAISDVIQSADQSISILTSGEDDIIISSTARQDGSIVCPITRMPMKEPLRNTKCLHTYSRAGIYQLLRSHCDSNQEITTVKIKCPIAGCGREVTTQTLIVDERLALELQEQEEREALESATQQARQALGLDFPQSSRIGASQHSAAEEYLEIED